MNSSNEHLTIDNEVVVSQRKGGSHVNGQEKSKSCSVIRVSDELREVVENYFKVKEIETSLKNTYVDSEGNLCLIRLEETSSNPIPFISLWNSYGPGKMYDPTAKQQRRDKQHSISARKQMLLSYIGKEDLGKFILMCTENGRFLIIDGRQRSSLVNEFLTDVMKLTGSDASNFWKWFLNDQHLYNEKLSSEESIKCNKILQTMAKGTMPSVIFSKLPETIKNHIFYNLNSQSVTLRVSVHKMGRTLVRVDESQWNIDEVSDAITRKFIDINQFHKAIDKKDIIWSSAVPMVSLVRDFLEDKPILGQRFGYTLKDKCENGLYKLDDTNEVRKFMILISRALLIYQKTLQWGSSEGEVVKIVLNNTELGNFNSQTKNVFRFWKKILDGKLMGDTYIGENGETCMLEIPEEFTKSSTDILKLSYFLTTLYVMEMMLFNNYGEINHYLISGEPTKKFYKLIEKVSVCLTLGRLANINHKEWQREDLPLVKYNLGDEFFSNEIFNGVEVGTLLNKVKDLNQHQKGLSKDCENTLITLIKYCETKIN